MQLIIYKTNCMINKNLDIYLLCTFKCARNVPGIAINGVKIERQRI